MSFIMTDKNINPNLFHEIRCPFITTIILGEVVKAKKSNGEFQYYSENEIGQWIDSTHQDPITRLKLERTDLIPATEEYRKKILSILHSELKKQNKSKDQIAAITAQIFADVNWPPIILDEPRTSSALNKDEAIKRLIDIVENIEFWSSRTRLTYKSAPDGIKKMRAAITEVKRDFPVEKQSDEIFSRCQLIASYHYDRRSAFSLFNLFHVDCQHADTKLLYQALLKGEKDNFMNSEWYQKFETSFNKSVSDKQVISHRSK